MISHTGIIHQILFPSLLWRMPGKKVYLTFDDGPHTAATPAVLDLLKKHEVRATFFLSGKNIQGREEIVRRIADEGHSIGIHAFNHSRSLALSETKTKEEILQTKKIIADIIHQNVRLFRPPFGFFSRKTISAARELGCILVMWSCLTGDFRQWTHDRVVRVSLKNLSDGAILVYHDNDLTQHRIVDILDSVIPEIKRRGYSFGAIR